MRAPSVTKYIPVTSGRSLPDIWRQGSTDIYIHQGSTSQQKRKEYVPTTLRTFTLLGFAVICLGIIAVLEVLARTSLAQPYGGFIKRDATEWPGPDSDTAYEPYRHVISEKQKLRFERAIAGRAESSSLSSSHAGTELRPSSTHPPPPDLTQSKVTLLEKAHTSIVADESKAPSIQAIPSHSKADEEDPAASPTVLMASTVAPDKYATVVVLNPDTSGQKAAPETSKSTRYHKVHTEAYATDAVLHPGQLKSSGTSDSESDHSLKYDRPESQYATDIVLRPITNNPPPQKTESTSTPNPNVYASSVELHPVTSPTISTLETAAPEKYATDVVQHPITSKSPGQKAAPETSRSTRYYKVHTKAYATDVELRPVTLKGTDSVHDDSESDSLPQSDRPETQYATDVDLHPVTHKEPPTTARGGGGGSKTYATSWPTYHFATDVNLVPAGSDSFAPSRVDETESTTYFYRPTDQFATDVDLDPEVTSSIDGITASQRKHPGHTRIDDSRSASGDGESRPSDHTFDPSVTLVEVDDRFIKTHGGPLLTVHTTNSNGVSTTLHLIESPVDTTTKPEVTLVAVNEKYAKTYGGSIRTIRTTNADGARTTLLLADSTVDGSDDEPVITRGTDDDHFGEAYEAKGRLVTVHTTNAEGSSTTFLMLETPTTIVSEHKPTDESFVADSTAQSQKSSSIIPKFGFEVFYFSGQYLPTLVAVLLSMFWKIIDTDIKRIEPFYLLSHTSGTSAKALNENLLFKNAIVVPFQAAWRRQWIVCLSALIYCPLLTFAHILAVTSFSLSTVKKCDPFADRRNCGSPFLAMEPMAVRILQGVLGGVVLGVIAIVLLQRRRTSLLSSEPWSLAGLATLLADWGAIQNAFANIEVADSEADLKRKVAGKGHRFRLAYSMNGEQQHLGIELVESPYETDVPDTLNDTSHIYRRRLRSNRPSVLKDVSLIAFILFLCGVLTIVMVYQTTGNSLIEHFMSGQSLSVLLLFIILGVVIRAGWEPIERGAYLPSCMESANDHAEVRFLEVFHVLSHRHQRVTTLLRDHPRSFPLVTEVSSLIQGNFFISFVGTVGLLIEVLIVTLTGVPYSGSQIWKDAKICMRLSSTIICITIITIAVILLRRKRVERRLPRVPYSLATVIGYIYAARMLDSLIGLSILESKARNRRIMEIGRGKKYGFGWTVGSDGAERVGVDEEELQGNYKR